MGIDLSKSLRYGDRRYSDIMMDPGRAVSSWSVTNAKVNAMENDSTWGVRMAVEGIQRKIIEATGNTRDLGSLFLYHTWAILVIVSSILKNPGDSLTISDSMNKVHKADPC